MLCDDVLESASRLPPDQQFALIDQLLVQLHGVDESEHVGAWEAEIRQRVSQIESAEVELIEGESVVASVKASLRR